MSQDKYEREFRIRKSQFPIAALDMMESELQEVKRLKFYKETDSAKTSFEAKFKKDRLWYSVEFDEKGHLEDIEVLIKEVDIPSDALAKMITYFESQFSKYRIKRIQQQYPANQEQLKETFRNAFQNLLLPSLNYELIVAGKVDKNYFDYEILFDAEGNFKKIRKSLPPNYDHVLY
ncbi:hypothetical protein [Maribacter sp. 4U21]|uniref:hypothetical protein n=1 Tax=Maribacter sp. 4U21 TaxID=1889779 RepID=UPI00211E517E|nr:hypothetical protein [Maribacter sp. 4U21]